MDLTGNVTRLSRNSLDIPGNKRESVPWEQLNDPFTEDIAMALGIDYDDYPFQWFYTLDDSLKMSRQELTGGVTDFLQSASGESGHRL